MEAELKGLRPHEKVFIVEPHGIFAPCVSLLTVWIVNAGAKIVAKADATLQIVLRLDDHEVRRLDVPTIYVATEQASSPFYIIDGVKRQYCDAAFVWCMDKPDMDVFRHQYCIAESKLCYAPVMLGTHWTYATTKTIPPSEQPPIAVLHFGAEHARRKTITDAVAEKLRGALVVDTSTAYGDKLRQLLLRTKVVVVINYWPEPLTFPLHRLAMVLSFPQVQVVMEACDGTPAYSELLDPFLRKRVHIVPYNAVADTAVRVARAPPYCDPTGASPWSHWLTWDGAPKRLTPPGKHGPQ